MTHFEFIIDTTEYSGNFEREMCAYMTGQIGECEVGNNMANLFNEDVEDINFDDIILQKSDDSGCYRPCYITPTPNRVNNGSGTNMDLDSEEANQLKQTHDAFESVAIFFEKNPSEYIDFLKKRAQEFVSFHKGFGNKKPYIKIIGFRLSEVTTVTNTTPIKI